MGVFFIKFLGDFRLLRFILKHLVLRNELVRKWTYTSFWRKSKGYSIIRAGVKANEIFFILLLFDF